MSSQSSTVIPISRLRREAEQDTQQTQREMRTARINQDRIQQYVSMLDALDEGLERLQSGEPVPRAFFIRSFAQMIGHQRTFTFDEFHIPSFSGKPALSTVYPAERVGTLDDCLMQACHRLGCDNRLVPVVGTVSYNKAGYHGPPSTVVFYALCTCCRSVAVIDQGYPYEERE